MNDAMTVENIPLTKYCGEHCLSRQVDIDHCEVVMSDGTTVLTSIHDIVSSARSGIYHWNPVRGSVGVVFSFWGQTYYGLVRPSIISREADSLISVEANIANLPLALRRVKGYGEVCRVFAVNPAELVYIP